MKPDTTKAQTRRGPGRARLVSLGPVAMVKAIDEGLPFSELEALRALLEMPLDKLAPTLGMSRATLHRRKRQGRLTREESDKVVRFVRLLDLAAEVIGDEETARRWLKRPQRGLAGAVPLVFAETEAGSREVELLLRRIDHAVYA
jgi:putative toxin-antitoxin system antitoxin component (TIGR02293 family)